MELYQLRSFVAVAAENHLTRAAEKLHISQPAVSAHIKALEEEFGLILFERTPTGMKLSSEGKELCALARKILGDVRSMVRLAERLCGAPSGTIRIGLNRHAEFLRITPLYRELRARFPGIEVVLHQSISGTVIKEVGSGSLDCGFILGECVSPEITVLELAGYRLRVVGPVALQKLLQKSDLAGLADFPWIGIPDDCPYRPVMERFFYSRGLKLQTEVVADQMSAIISMIESGAGLSFMLEEEALAAAKRGQVAIWPGGDFPITLSFIHRTADENSPVVEAVKEIIRILWIEAPEAGEDHLDDT